MAGNSVRLLFPLCVTMVCSLSALQPGKRYDFFCHDGQDIFNAEYVSEDNNRYFVKLSALVTSVPIEKGFVRHIQESPSVKSEKASEYTLTANAGALVATGRLANFSGFAPALSFSGRRSLPWHISAVVRTDVVRFQRDAMSLSMISFLPGIEYAPQYSLALFTGAIGIAAGGAYMQGLSESATVRALIPAAITYMVLRRHLTAALFLTFSVTVSYFHDKLNPLVLPGLFAGVEYRL